MSESDVTEERMAAGGSSKQPRAVIHKKVLEAAGSRPEASIETLADEISGASTELVERVLDEYGDPAATESEDASHDDDGDESAGQQTAPDPADSSEALLADGSTTEVDRNGHTDEFEDVEPAANDDKTTESETNPASVVGVTAEALDETELELLRAVAKQPDATQDVIADRLDVSRATVSRRLSGIDGFEWPQREKFVDRLFDDGVVSTGRDATGSQATGELADSLDALSERVDDLSADVRRLESGTDDTDAGTDRSAAERDTEPAESDETPSGTDADDAGKRRPFADPQLAHKVVHACMDAECVTEEEELRILRSILDEPE